ncbi:Phospholipase_D-nuclease N-terminal [Halopelagius inordinatus]|uniref:Phospholipase_D-nuclease N-terminal n=1 Tax=Halopelagius inordinatus TaxID=553467 RepID=A0A1I2LH69_9EURY|nr:PLDc N-terminal domain-containing protein [Halopelagius inordinatus]SFF78373.1 Phospholipase_D-nuclease N-terminal [Halopelagius inordinatus]
MATTRSPILILVGLVAAAFVPLAAMWAVVGDVELLAYFLGFAVYFLVFHVAVPGHVYFDSRARGSNSVLAWTALSFLLPVVGAAVYFLVGQRRLGEPAG